ncbi:hypothetical protein GPJ56_000767 [Histomonas meleagridis]|uniref:uncharacterized protein n=1 Tax=Histomonas meleagridis TaxID=135588 RepID=UPI00355A4D3C|nr:hypothetical protein GPJ56_000767 [Histomonas meleagridis]KAH0804474.1 hypothetical protein GO595_003304 [Histomonas meleagridis]
MSKRFNLLILGPETRIGQSIIRKISDNFHFLNVAVPTGIYKEQTALPPYQIAMNFVNVDQLVDDFSLAEVVISCSPLYSTEVIKNAAVSAGAKFIDACYSYPQAVIEAACHRLPFHPTMMEASQSASGCSISDFWIISHQLTILPFPHCRNGKWVIEQGTVSLEDISVPHHFEFSGKFYAILFWLISLFFRFIFPFFHLRKPYTSTSRWKFSGKTLEHHKEYQFKAMAEGVDAELLRPELAFLKALDALGIERSESRNWGCCSKLKVKLTEYTATTKDQI